MTEQQAPLILVVDDYQDAREMYAEYLQFSGFRVAEARNGNEAIEQAFALHPDLILMDLSLPGMDGWEATRQLKSDDRTRHIPIVALTADPSTDIGVRARRAGCVGVITKPVLPDEVARQILVEQEPHAVARRRSRRAANSMAARRSTMDLSGPPGRSATMPSMLLLMAPSITE